jgi:predicted RNA binding protein YcfA (HicA-like mRNA interferase family)
VKAVSGKRFCRVLEAQGWKLARIRGSYLIYMKADSNFLVSVPVHGDTSLKTGA